MLTIGVACVLRVLIWQAFAVLAYEMHRTPK